MATIEAIEMVAVVMMSTATIARMVTKRMTSELVPTTMETARVLETESILPAKPTVTLEATRTLRTL